MIFFLGNGFVCFFVKLLLIYKRRINIFPQLFENSVITNSNTPSLKAEKEC